MKCFINSVFVTFMFTCILVSTYIINHFVSGRKEVTTGKSMASKSSVVICGLARNIDGNCQSKMKELEEIGRRFNEYKIVIVTNNNSDNTEFILSDWANRNSRVDILKMTDDQVVFDRSNSNHPNAHDSRIRRMARLRECYLEHVKQNYGNYSYMLVVDFDVELSNIETSRDGFFKSFAKKEWSAIFINGQGMKEFTPYDSLAYIRHGTNEPFLQHHDTRAHQLRVATKFTNTTYLQVESAFGGYGLYKINDIGNASYLTKNDSNCEHHTFHYQIQGRKYINLEWIGRYTAW
jgi:hypothetical protein